MSEQVPCLSKNEQYVHLIERVLWDSLRPTNPAWLDEKDKSALKWALCLLYLVWCDLCVAVLGKDAPLLRIDTALSWAKQISSQNVVELLQLMEVLDGRIQHASPVELPMVLSNICMVLPMPCSRQVGESLLSGYSFPEISGYAVREAPILRRIRTLLCLMSRIDLSRQLKNALEEWLECEDRVASIGWKPDWRLASASTRHPWRFPSRELIRSKLSSGAIADLPGARGRVYMKCDAEVSISRTCAKTAWLMGLISPNATSVAENSAKLIDVPKNYKTRRAIVEEPLTNAWLQASTQRFLQAATAARWGPSCDPRDPSWNRDAIAYEWERWCTIDLKQASDSVRKDHVVAVSAPLIRRLAFGARTPTVRLPKELGGTLHSLAKFAGMGNGHTFSLEENVFACGIASVVDHAPKREQRYFGVHGDDCVVHHSVYDGVCERFEELGFIVNEAKSFGPHTHFRESCGVDVFEGAQVTPVRLSRKWTSVIETLGAIFPCRPRGPEAEAAATSLVAQAVDFAHAEIFPVTTRYLYDNLRRRGARFSNEPCEVWDENKCRYYATVLHSPTADERHSRSFGREDHTDYYSDNRGTRRYSGSVRNGLRKSGHYGTVLSGEEVILSSASLNWALSSPEGDWGTAYPWLYDGSPLPLREVG